jgi:hypothetical protein
MVPFIALFGNAFHQGVIQIVLVFIIGVLAFVAARQNSFTRQSSFFLSCAFLFGSFVLGIIVDPKSWFYAQVVAMVCLFAALVEWQGRKRPFILGLFLAGIFATRPTAGLFIFVVVWEYISASNSFSQKIKQCVLLFVPVVLCGMALLWFNYARFGAFLDNGYTTNNIGGISEPLRDIGVFSLQHVPMNFYWYFLASVDPVQGSSAHLEYPYVTYRDWGLSLILLSPFFLYAFRSLRNKRARPLWIVTGVTFFILLTYFNTGWRSFGPRYAADIWPVVFILLLIGLRRTHLTIAQSIMILVSVSFNMYLLYTTPLH